MWSLFGKFQILICFLENADFKFQLFELPEVVSFLLNKQQFLSSAKGL